MIRQSSNDSSIPLGMDDLDSTSVRMGRTRDESALPSRSYIDAPQRRRGQRRKRTSDPTEVRPPGVDCEVVNSDLGGKLVTNEELTGWEGLFATSEQDDVSQALQLDVTQLNDDDVSNVEVEVEGNIPSIDWTK